MQTTIARSASASTRVAIRATSSARPIARIVPRATPEDKEPAPGTVMYGGKSYTEAEFAEAAASGKLGAPAPPATSPAAAQTSFFDVMAFSGSAPEIVNGRLAMLGFVAAVGAELASGESVVKQLAIEPTGIAAVFMLFIAASLVPALQGKKAEAVGPLTPSAELLNGRAAMIGFASMLIIEAVNGATLF